MRFAVALCALVWAIETPPASFGAPPAPASPTAAVPAPPGSPQTAPAATGSSTKDAPPPVPASIPVPEIVARAEEVTKRLRELDALTEPVPAINTIQTRLPEVKTRLGPEFKSIIEILEQGPPIGIQERLTQSWLASASELAGWQDVVTKRATQLERELDGLAGLRVAWTRTRADAQASHAPPAVLRNVDDVLADLDAMRARLQVQRADMLVLQGQVAEQAKRCEEALAQIARLRQGSLELTLTRSTPPIWSPQLHPGDFKELPARIASELGVGLALLRQFATDHAVRLFLHGLLFIGLILLARAARTSAGARDAAIDGARQAAVVFDRPYSAAAVMALVSVFWIYPGRPRTVGDVTGILLLIPMLRLLRPMIARAMAPALYAFAVLALVDRVRAQLVVTALGDQIILLLEMLAGAAVLVCLLGSRSLRRALVEEGLTPRRLRAQDIAAGFGLIVCAASFAAAAHGTMRLARWLGSGLLVDVFLVVAAYAAINVADGLLAFALRVWPLCRLGMVQGYRDLLERRTRRALRWIISGTVIVAILDHRGLRDSAVELARDVLTAELRRGGIGISLADVLAFLLTVWLAFCASAFIRFLLSEDVFPRLRLGRGLPYAISTLLHYTILLLGFLLAVAALGVDLNKVTILAGAFGVGLGFGLQGIVNNFVSGLIVLLERPMHVGDAIEMADVAGEVRHIGMRSTLVHTWEGAEVIVPNASLVAEKVTNWTLADRQRRIDVPVGVAYGSRPEKVLELLLGVAAAHPRLMTRPVPQALFMDFGDSALKFELRAWTDRFDTWLEIKSELNVAVHAALQEAGFEIAVPQREVRLRQS
jgi:potassium-dependent mechanosensitive channel